MSSDANLSHAEDMNGILARLVRLNVGLFLYGFTMAMTCSCHGRVVTGCNKDLDKLATCPVRTPIP